MISHEWVCLVGVMVVTWVLWAYAGKGDIEDDGGSDDGYDAAADGDCNDDDDIDDGDDV